MNASLVFDGGEVIIPESMGSPTRDQMDGTPLENLGECASRICYDSLGYDGAGKPRGRPGARLHEHILEVRNHSVYEHGNFTVRFESDWQIPIMLSCLNRKGVWVETPEGADGVTEVTVNLRAVLEWDRHACRANRAGGAAARVAGTLRHFAHRLAPRVVTGGGEPMPGSGLKTASLTDDQAWVTLWLYGSRGFTHEQVRHRFAMSQRSTRYVDEDGSPYVTHPLVTKYLGDDAVPEADRVGLSRFIDESVAADRKTYRAAVAALQDYNVAAGLDRQTARKQARGAARGYLGNALASEMLFSAPVSGWKWILSQRKNKAADAEIRQIYSPGLDALKASRYGDRFAHFTTVPSPDGIGTVLA